MIEKKNEFLQDDEFEFKIVQLRRKLALLINWTTDNKKIRGYLTPKKPYFFVNNETKKPSLILYKKSAIFDTSTSQTEDKEVIKDMEEMGEQVSQLIGFITLVLGTVLGFTILLGIGGSVVTKLIRLFEVINRYNF